MAPASSAPAAGQQHQEPRPERRRLADLAEDLLAARPQGDVAGPRLEREPLQGLDAREEERPEDPRRRAHERRVQEDAAEDLQLEGRAGRPEQRSQRRKPPRGGSRQAGGLRFFHHRSRQSSASPLRRAAKPPSEGAYPKILVSSSWRLCGLAALPLSEPSSAAATAPPASRRALTKGRLHYRARGRRSSRRPRGRASCRPTSRRKRCRARGPR